MTERAANQRAAARQHDDFRDVTETAGQYVTNAQYSRHCNRYYWAGEFCVGKAVLEVACGAATGLGYLQRNSASVIGIDISEPVLAGARSYYGNRADLRVMDAHDLRFSANSFDVVIIFEALYYLQRPEKFVEECARVLRRHGKVLVCNANKDLYDFNRSPWSFEYHGVSELKSLFGRYGFTTEFWGGSRLSEATWLQRFLRPVKAFASKSNLIPKTMGGKRLLKRLIFGKLRPLPPEVLPLQVERESLDRLCPNEPARNHQVIYCVATLES